MIKFPGIVGILLFYCLSTDGRQISPALPYQERSYIKTETDRYLPRNNTTHASDWFDVTYYRLNLSISANPQYLSGVVTIKGICRQNSDSLLVLDLMNTMQIDSVEINGTVRPFNQYQSSFNIRTDSVYLPGQILTVQVYYRGIPASTGFGSFVFSYNNGIPWIWSLSEPYGAKDWWPCKDHPHDKADSADIIVTCDSSLKVGSNGMLISEINNQNGTKTYYWQERYPIAPYLLSVAITNYAQFSNWFRYTLTDSMEILNYVLPENLSTALAELPRTVEMLRIFSDYFGLYPFIKEKYGHAEFGQGGAMEHQTMTSTVTFSENVIAHELAHQWFGDMITCKNWTDLWLNEGFAQYSIALYREKKYGKSEYWQYINNEMDNARQAAGSLYILDTSSVQTLFDSKLVYSKGASVLHMLRHLLGDNLFFQTLYNYANDTTIRYKTASTSDFKRVCEKTSGRDLTFFFDEWIYGENYPHYSFQWYTEPAAHQYIVTVDVAQTSNVSNPPFFKMPLDIKFTAVNWDTTITVFNDLGRQLFSFQLPYLVKNVELDPDGWILKSVVEEFPKQFVLEQNNPNPFRSTTQIEYKLPEQMRVKLTVFNILGQEVADLVNGIQTMGVYSLRWNVDMLPSGIYFYRLQTSGQAITKKLIIFR